MKVLLLHALPLDERMWEPQHDALTAHDVVAPNLYALPGQTMESWALELLRELAEPVAIVGASMGGYAALALARLAPERVAALVLAGSRADADSDDRRADRADTIRRVEQGGAEALWEKMRPLLTAGASDEVAARVHGIALGQRSEDLVRALAAIRDRPDSTDVVASLDAPVLVLVGEEDALVAPQEAEALAGRARNGRAVVLEGAGHLPSLQRPDRFNAELVALLDGLG